MRRTLLVAALVLGCGGAVAQDEEPTKIAVNAIKQPEMRSYRAVLAGLDKFDDEHALAPAAPGLRFRVILNRGTDTSEEPLQARIAGDDLSIVLPIDPDGRFTVPRSEAAYAAKADLLLNRKKRSFRIVPDVRSAGLADNVRRLGDLRLECKVMVAIAKEEIPFWAVAMVNGVLLSGDWCAKLGDTGKMSFKSTAPLVSATISHGERRQQLETGTSTYHVPIAAKDWPDDALVTLEYAQ